MFTSNILERRHVAARGGALAPGNSAEKIEAALPLRAVSLFSL